MWKCLPITLAAVLLCSTNALAQIEQTQVDLTQVDLTQVERTSHESSSRLELKQSVAKMTFESGDRRIIQLPSNVQYLKKNLEQSPNLKASNSLNSAPPSTAADQITVQCNPLGEAEAIGIIPDTFEKFTDRGEPIEVFASDQYNLSTEKWRRIAELACLEDEI